MSRIIHGTLFVPSYQPTGNPGEWLIENAIYTNVSDDTGQGAYAIQTGFVVYVPAANINTQLPVPGVVHRYKITSHTVVNASTINCTILWDEGGSEVDIPHNGDYAMISEVGTGQGLAFPVSNQIYPLMKAGMDIAAIAVEEKVKIDKIQGGSGGGSSSVEWDIQGTPAHGDIYPWKKVDSAHTLSKFSVVAKQTSSSEASFYVDEVDTSLDFNTFLNGGGTNLKNVRAIAKDQSGNTFIGGDFKNYGNVKNRNYLVKINADGTVDSQFCLNAVDKKFNSYVNAIAIQEDGKILIGGSFSNYAPSISYLIRLNTDGTLDTDFTTNLYLSGIVDAEVYCIALQADWKILIGGIFYSRFARLENSGNQDGQFNYTVSGGLPFGESVVYAVAVNNSTGKIFVGGNLTYFEGGSFPGDFGDPFAPFAIPRTGLVCFDSMGSVDWQFCANAVDYGKFDLGMGGAIYSIAIEADGKVLVGGQFYYNLTPGRQNLVRFFQDGTLDEVFCVNAVDSKLNAIINSIVVHRTGVHAGKILIGGGNQQAYGANVIRFNSTGTRDTSFTFQGQWPWDVKTLCLGENSFLAPPSILEQILVGGDFINYQDPKLKGLLILNPLGELEEVNTLKISKDYDNIIEAKKIVRQGSSFIIGGNFSFQQSDRKNLIKISSDGTLDLEFCLNASDGSKFNGVVNSIATQPDGKILVGGAFTNHAGISGRSYLLRLNPDGTPDSSFVIENKLNGYVSTILVKPNGNILIGGNFTNYQITGFSYLVELNPDGTLSSSTLPISGKFNNIVDTICLQGDYLLAGGVFTNYAGTSGRSFLIKFTASGAVVDTNFALNAIDNKFNGRVTNIEFNPSLEKIYVGGNFSNWGGQTGTTSLVSFNLDGTLNTEFVSNTWEKVSSCSYISIQPDNKIVVSGASTYTGTSYSVFRLNADGTPDFDFLNNIFLEISSYYVFADVDGIFIAGSFRRNYSGNYASPVFRQKAEITLPAVSYAAELPLSLTQSPCTYRLRSNSFSTDLKDLTFNLNYQGA